MSRFRHLEGLGLWLAGGNSFFAARYGFVCDNVRGFEVCTLDNPTQL